MERGCHECKDPLIAKDLNGTGFLQMDFPSLFALLCLMGVSAYQNFL